MGEGLGGHWIHAQRAEGRHGSGVPGSHHTWIALVIHSHTWKCTNKVTRISDDVFTACGGWDARVRSFTVVVHRRQVRGARRGRVVVGARDRLNGVVVERRGAGHRKLGHA